MTEIRTCVRAIILAVTGILVVLVLVRLVLQLIGANASQPIVSLILNLSEFLVAPFREFNSFLNSASTDIGANITALMVVVVGGLLVSDVVTAFLHDNVTDIVMHFVDAIFKTLEAILMVRLVLKLFGIPAVAGLFVSNIYDTTSWANGVFPAIKVFNSGVLELSTLAIIIIIAVVDFSTESLVASMRKQRKAETAAEKTPAPVVAPPANVTVHQAPAQPAAQPMQQHITINVPVPTAAPVQPRVDHQVINVQAPPPAIPQNP